MSRSAINGREKARPEAFGRTLCGCGVRQAKEKCADQFGDNADCILIAAKLDLRSVNDHFGDRYAHVAAAFKPKSSSTPARGNPPDRSNGKPLCISTMQCEPFTDLREGRRQGGAWRKTLWRDPVF